MHDVQIETRGNALHEEAPRPRHARDRRTAGALLALAVPVFLIGLGVLGVGIFPGNRGAIHQLFAMLAFSAGGLSGVLAATVLAGPARVISRALGGVSLLTLLLILFVGEAGPLGWLGDGGAERWVAYPVVLWMVVAGGYLMAPEAAASRPARAGST